MGIVVDGELYRGARGAAGEFGHVDAGGDALCACGKRGCLETMAAEPALLAAARRRRIIGTDAGPEDLAAAAAAGHRGALEIYAAAGTALGKALAAAAVVLNPQARRDRRRGQPRLAVHGRRRSTKHSTPGCSRRSVARLPIHVERWDDTTWALGAAALVLRAPFLTPMHEHPAIEAIRGRLDAGFRSPLAAAERRDSRGRRRDRRHWLAQSAGRRWCSSAPSLVTLLAFSLGPMVGTPGSACRSGT